VLNPLGREALQECIEPGDSEGDPTRTRQRRVPLDEQPGALVDLPERLVPNATIRRPPEQPCVPIDAGLEIGDRNTGEEVRDRAHLGPVLWHDGDRHLVLSRAILTPVP
jgi:hypothetical protein